MFLSDKQVELQQILDDLRKQIELLDSHKVVGLINDKQYKESMYHIAKTLDGLERELGVPPYKYNAFDLMYKESMEKFEKDINETIRQADATSTGDELIFKEN